MEYLFLFLAICIAVAIGFEVAAEKLAERAVRNAPTGLVEKLCEELDHVGNTKSKSYFVVGNKPGEESGTFSLKMPAEMDVQWLRSKTVLAKFVPSETDTPNTSISVVDTVEHPTFLLAPIPRIEIKNGKKQNRYTPEYWMKKNCDLKQMAQELHRRDPSKALSLLFDRFGRVNAPFNWAQTPKQNRCKTCRRKMMPVLQIWGGAIGCDGEANYYVSACECSANTFSIEVQYT